jgi:hypothetical protein
VTGTVSPITVGRSWKTSRQAAAARKADEHATQAWRPCCARCGEGAHTFLPSAQAEDWWATHRRECAATA